MGDAFDLLERNLKKTAALVIAAGAQQEQRILDRFERIIDFMSNRSREPADGRQLFRLEQLLLQTPAFEFANAGEIVKDGDYGRDWPPWTLNFYRRYLHRQKLARC